MRENLDRAASDLIPRDSTAWRAAVILSVAVAMLAAWGGAMRAQSNGVTGAVISPLDQQLVRLLARDSELIVIGEPLVDESASDPLKIKIIQVIQGRAEGQELRILRPAEGATSAWTSAGAPCLFFLKPVSAQGSPAQAWRLVAEHFGVQPRNVGLENLLLELASRPLPVPGTKPADMPGMVWIAPGEFMMGSPPDESGRDPDEGPQTRVVIPDGFWIQQNEVTQSDYQQLMGANPSSNVGTNFPVEKVTWFEAVSYCGRLTERDLEAGRLPEGYAYRLPTEAEWEFACRAGTTTRFSHGQDANDAELKEFAWFTRNSESNTHPVGTRRPNPWGLHDLHGNVWEWCLDRWEGGLPGGVITNQPAASKGNLRVGRGGSWLYEAKACRSANRDDYSPWNRCSDVGFRVVLAPVGGRER